MPDNKKVDEASKAAATNTASTPDGKPKDETPARNAPDQPADTIKTPTVADVKTAAAPSASKDNLNAHVDAVAKSVEAANKSKALVGEAVAGVKPKQVEAPPLPTADERIQDHVDATAKSVENYKKSVELEKKSTPESSSTTSVANETLKPEVSRVAPLTGELRADPEEDSYLTPGKVLQPVSPAPSGVSPPEPAPPPKVISPLTGEVKPADEISYPTPGHVKDPNLANDLSKKAIRVEASPTKFGVREGEQVNLLTANHEMWDNDAARMEDRRANAEAIAASIVTGDGLRRTRRAQKNLR